MANIRSANSTLKGYYYQFDKTIIELLKQDSGTLFTVEGIEDIDISSESTELIQCKYIESTNLTPSSVSKAIAYLFLQNKKNKVKTRLYGYFKTAKRTVDETLIKKALSKSDAIKIIGSTPTDANIKLFIRSFKYEEGEKLDCQHNNCKSIIKDIFGCKSDIEVEMIYSKALKTVFSLAIRKSKKDRTLSRAEFIKQIDKSKEHYSYLLKKYKGETAYTKYVRETLKEDLYIAKDKAIILSSTNSETNSLLVKVIQKLTMDYYWKESPTSAKPLTFSIKANKQSLNYIKGELVKKGVYLNDGYESTGVFMINSFNDMPFVKTNKSGSKIEKASYYVRIVSFKNFKQNFTELTHYCSVIDFAGVFTNKHENIYIVDTIDYNNIINLLKK